MKDDKLRIRLERVSHDHQHVDELETIEVPMEFARSYADALEQVSGEFNDMVEEWNL